MSAIAVIVLAMVSVGVFVAFGLWQRLWHPHTSHFEVGRVSEGWLAEQSGRRNL